MCKRNHALFFAVVLCVFACVCNSAQKPDTQPVALELPHAGVTIGVLNGFEPQPLQSSKELVRLVKFSGETPLNAVVLAAYLAEPQDDLESAAKAVQDMMTNSLAVRDLQILKSTDIPVSGVKGKGTLMKYSFRGQETYAAQTYFIRELKTVNLRICYILSVETPKAFKDQLLPLLGKVIQSIKLTALQSPSACKAKLSDNKISGDDFSLLVPQNWFAEKTDRGVTLMITDYLSGGMHLPSVDVLSVNLPGNVSSDGCIKKAVAAFTQQATQEKKQASIIAQRQVTVAGKTSHQMVMSIKPLSPKTATAPNADSGEVIRAVTAVCVPGKENSTKSYAIILTARGNDAKMAEKWMNVIAGGFELAPKSK